MGPRGGHFVTRSLPAAAVTAAPGPRDPPSAPFREAQKGKAGSHRGSGAKAEPYTDAVPISAASKSRFQNDRWAPLGSGGGDAPVDLSPARRGSLINSSAPFAPFPAPSGNDQLSCPQTSCQEMNRNSTATGGSWWGWRATGQDHTQATAIPTQGYALGGGGCFRLSLGNDYHLPPVRADPEAQSPGTVPQTEAPPGQGLGDVPGAREQKP